MGYNKEIGSIRQIINGAYNRGNLISVDGGQYREYLSNDRVLCSVITDRIFGAGKNSNVMTVALETNKRIGCKSKQYIFTSNKMLSYNSITALAYKLRLEGHTIVSAINIGIDRDTEYVNILIESKNGINILIDSELSGLINQLITERGVSKYIAHYVEVLGIRSDKGTRGITRYIGSALDACFQTLNTYKIISGDCKYTIIEFEHITCIYDKDSILMVGGDEVEIYRCADELSKVANNFFAHRNLPCKLTRIGQILML